MAKLTAEEFLRDKLQSEIAEFGDGTTEFHTRDVAHLLQCLEDKDVRIKHTELQCIDLIAKINYHAEQKLKDLLADCMTINNVSAEQRLGYIRREYKGIWDELTNQKY